MRLDIYIISYIIWIGYWLVKRKYKYMQRQQSLEAGYTYRSVNRALISAASGTRASQQKDTERRELSVFWPSDPTRDRNQQPGAGGRVQRLFRDSLFNDACLAFAEIERYASIFLGNHNNKQALLGCILNFADIFRPGDDWRHMVVIWLYEVGLLPRAVCKNVMDFLIICP